MQIEEMRGNHLGLVIGVIQPCVFLLVTLGSIGDRVEAEGTRWATAVVLTSLWAATVWIAGSILRIEKLMGTLARSITSVQPGFLVLLGKSLGATARSLVIIVGATGVTLLATGTAVHVDRPAWFALGLLAAAASGVALGMLLSCALLLTLHGTEVAAALMYPVFILGGLMIPVEALPAPVRWIPATISLSWAQRFLTGAASGEVPFIALGMLVALTVLYFACALVAFSRIADRARRKGTLDLV